MAIISLKEEGKSKEQYRYPMNHRPFELNFLRGKTLLSTEITDPFVRCVGDGSSLDPNETRDLATEETDGSALTEAVAIFIVPPTGGNGAETVA